MTEDEIEASKNTGEPLVYAGHHGDFLVDVLRPTSSGAGWYVRAPDGDEFLAPSRYLSRMEDRRPGRKWDRGMSGLDDVATRVYAGPVIASLPHSRLEQMARMAFVAETLRVLREAAGG